jgi:hypothetical protein
MPEDWYVPMHDFEVHMKMLDYLHEVQHAVQWALWDTRRRCSPIFVTRRDHEAEFATFEKKF